MSRQLPGVRIRHPLQTRLHQRHLRRENDAGVALVVRRRNVKEIENKKFNSSVILIVSTATEAGDFCEILFN